MRRPVAIAAVIAVPVLAVSPIRSINAGVDDDRNLPVVPDLCVRF